MEVIINSNGKQINIIICQYQASIVPLSMKWRAYCSSDLTISDEDYDLDNLIKKIADKCGLKKYKITSTLLKKNQ